MPARSWKFHAGRLLLVASLVLLAGWLAGHPVVVCGAVASAYACWHLANLWRLTRWLQSSDNAIPESYGIWSDIYESIDKLERNNDRQKKKYRAMIEEFRGLTDAFPAAMLVIDENENLSWFNSGASAMLGLKAPEDLAKPVTNLLRNPEFADWLAVQSEVSSPLEIPSAGNDNTWFNVSAVEFRKKQGRAVSQKVESANKKIAIALQSLSEISFVYPYTEDRPRYLSDIEKELHNTVSDASR